MLFEWGQTWNSSWPETVTGHKNFSSAFTKAARFCCLTCFSTSCRTAFPSAHFSSWFSVPTKSTKVEKESEIFVTDDSLKEKSASFTSALRVRYIFDNSQLLPGWAWCICAASIPNVSREGVAQCHEMSLECTSTTYSVNGYFVSWSDVTSSLGQHTQQEAVVEAIALLNESSSLAFNYARYLGATESKKGQICKHILIHLS